MSSARSIAVLRPRVPLPAPGEQPRRSRVREARSAMVRARVVDANDGIIATAGIVEGFVGAGAGESTVLVAALAAMVAGGLSRGGATYTEEATEQDTRQVVLDEERRRLSLRPDEERAELAALYVAKGLPPELAREVADELSARDPLAAHADAEYGIAMHLATVGPVATGVMSGGSFALGAAVPLTAVILAPDSWRVPVIFGAVVASLAVTSLIASRAGGASLRRTLFRTVGIGTLAMLITLGGGSLLNL